MTPPTNPPMGGGVSIHLQTEFSYLDKVKIHSLQDGKGGAGVVCLCIQDVCKMRTVQFPVRQGQWRGGLWMCAWNLTCLCSSMHGFIHGIVYRCRSHVM